MNYRYGIYWVTIILMIAAAQVDAVDFTPKTDIDGQSRYDIKGMVNVTAIQFIGDGSELTGLTAVSTVEGWTLTGDEIRNNVSVAHNLNISNNITANKVYASDVYAGSNSLLATSALRTCPAGEFTTQWSGTSMVCGVPVGGSINPEWSQINGVITSNNSISNGNVNITGTMSLNENITLSTNNDYFNIILKGNNTNGYTELNFKLNENVPNSKVLWVTAPAGNVFTKIISNDKNEFAITLMNATSSGSSFSNSDGIINNKYGDILFKPMNTLKGLLISNDTSGNLQVASRGNNPIYFQQDSTWIAVHADAFTEHTTIYSGSKKEAKNDLKEWIKGNHPPKLGTPSVIVDEELCPEWSECELKGDCDKRACEIISSHIEYIGTDLGKAGKANALISISNSEDILKLVALLSNKSIITADEIESANLTSMELLLTDNQSNLPEGMIGGIVGSLISLMTAAGYNKYKKK